MNIGLTQTSMAEYARVFDREMTPEMAAQYLREERIVLRTFADALRQVYPGEDIQQRLLCAFLAGDQKPDTVSRRVRSWLSGQSRPARREDVWRIAFCLNLSEPQADFLLGQATDYGIHYRDGQDVVFAWFLRTGRSFDEAAAFFAGLPLPPHLDSVPPNASSRLTHEVCNEFLRVRTPEELRAGYFLQLENFGLLHLRAYNYFRRYLDQLIHPTPAWGPREEPDYSMEAVMRLYLSLRMPSGRDRSEYNVVQKLIKQNWPNTTALKNIYSRKADVPRKLLLLLYVITENLLDDGEDYVETDSLQARVADHWTALNAILTDCGMPRLDPRNATDWLVLYAIAAEDEPMSQRMENVIGQIFENKA